MFNIVGTAAVQIGTIYKVLQAVVVSLTALRCMMILMKHQNDDQPKSVALNKCWKVIKAAALAICITELVGIIQTYFPPGKDLLNTLKQGMIALSAKMRLSILALDATLTSLYCTKELISSQQAESDEKASHYMKIKKAVISGILIWCAYWFITIILNYYMGE